MTEKSENNSTERSAQGEAAVRTAISRRRSVRTYTDEPISKDTLDKLVQAGIDAPSGSNWQNQRFLVVDDHEEIMRIGKTRFVWPYKGANQSKIKQSHPSGIIGHSAAIIVVFSDSKENDRRGNGEYRIWQNLEIQNCSASIQNILVLATSMGLGSCWVSASDKMNYTRMLGQSSWRKLFANYEIPEWYKLQGIIMLGYPKSHDDLGYPVGEKKHGATIWKSTERNPIDYYLIQKKGMPETNPTTLTWKESSLLRLYSSLIRICEKISSKCDRRIHRIEIRKYLPDTES